MIMVLHPFSARKLGDRLARAEVTAPEQAFYLAGSSVVALPFIFLFLIPSPIELEPSWFFPIWFGEFLVLLVVSIAGVIYCLRRCWIAPARHFLIEFSCLYFPVWVTTFPIAWALFWVVAFGSLDLLDLWMNYSPPDGPMPSWRLVFATNEFSDVLRLLTIMSAETVLFYRIGQQMERISQFRESANPTIDADRYPASFHSPDNGRSS
ncbi:MAG: hypothetical protein HC814_02585 [Rhodobacteraceae bacterium]|nr:hypothetical protein [Paracoccaceae bacterium]